MSQQIKKKFLGPDQIGSDQILIEDGQALRAMDGATEVELVKISSSEVYLNGIKVLNSSDLIPADILPSYVDDVLEYADLTAIQAINPGEAGKIYVALDTNKCYRWSGSTYIQITSGAVDSVNGSTGVVVLESSDINLSSPVNSQTTVQGSLEDLEGRIDDLEIGGGDTKEVKISANDSTPGYLEDKVVGAAGKISISTLSDGLDEDLQISIGADVFDKTVDDTDDISEGTLNLFFTDARAKSAAVFNGINEGVTDVAPSQDAVWDALSLKLDSADFGSEFDANLALKDTDNLSEGITNLYFTDVRAKTAAVSDSITDGVTDVAPSQNAVFDALALVSGDVSNHINNVTGAHAASAISFDNTGTDIVAIDVQAALVELESDLETAIGAVADDVSHLVILSGVAVDSDDLGSFTGAILPAGLGIKEALQELSDAQEDHLNDSVDAHDASAISFAPAGNIIATEVQAAIQELDQDKLALAGGDMTGDINMQNTHTVKNLAAPVDAQDAATKQYVDAVAEGLHVHAPARLLVDSDLNASNGGVYNNGSSGVGAHIDFSTPISSIDGVTSFSVGNRIILTFQNGSSADIENGIYFIEDAADIDVNGDITKLTRTEDFNSPAEMAGGDFVFVQEGTQYADSGWVMTETVVTVGTTPVKFVQFSGAGTYAAGDALSLTGNEFDVKFDNSSIGVNGSNQLEVKALGISNGMLQDDSVTNAKIADDAVDESNIDANAIGNGLTGGSGTIISVDHDGEGLEFSGTQLSLELDGSTLAKSASGLKLNDTTVSAASYGTTAAKTASFTVDAQGRLTAASEQDISIVSTQMSDFQTAVRAEVSAGDGLDYSAVSGEFSVDLKAAGGLKIDATELAVEPADFAGHGLEDDGSDNLAIKKEFVTVPDISVSANGLSIVNRWGKETYLVTNSPTPDTVLASDYYDLDHEIEANSLVAFVDRLGIHEGVDYNLSVVSGVTRVTFIGDLIGPGPSQLASGDRLTFTYQKKAKA